MGQFRDRTKNFSTSTFVGTNQLEQFIEECYYFNTTDEKQRNWRKFRLNKSVVICESCFDNMEGLTQRLEYNRIRVIKVPRDGEKVLEALDKHKPDLLLCELFLPKYDAMAILNILKENDSKTTVVVSSLHNNSIFEEKVLQAGAACYIIRPYSLDRIFSLILTLLNVEEKEEKDVLCISRYGDRILEIYKNIGMNPSCLGAKYLFSAIEYCLENPKFALRGKVYPYIEEKYNTTYDRVERAMRHAIDSACKKGDYDAIISYFGAIIKPSKGKPTNFEFIDTITNHIRFFVNAKTTIAV